ncbi:MAG TPA: hypothetical protein VEP91_06750 [Solirubrobacterales bacterium]|nr:hypothetical protein [Solirubrobacterales bacterium]
MSIAGVFSGAGRSALGRLSLVLATLVAAVLAFSMYVAPKASAGFYGFCEGWGAGSYAQCHAQPFYHIVWSRVIVDPYPGYQGCASALNGNGVQVNSFVCTTTGLQATNYYDGSRYLQGLIKNNTRLYNVLHGNEEYR